MPRFKPPTPQEVEAYAKTLNFTLNGECFCDYYAQTNWELRNGRKVKDWKACVRTWKHRRAESQPKASPALSGPSVAELIQQFENKRHKKA